MSFSFKVYGHAGNRADGTPMPSNSEEEVDAVKAIIGGVLADAKERGLNLSIVEVNPSDWAPEKVSNLEARS
jgi:hypothetical protein